jgi:chitin disaccharide deacetylase
MSARHITLCADDYGISPAVSGAIRDLIGRGRINATSVMTVAPSFNRDEAQTLLAATQGGGAAIGLHVTLTAPFRPLSGNFAPLKNGAFPSLPAMLLRAQLRLLKLDLLTGEISRQFEVFKRAFGRPPDFVDGHQHVHIFPQVRDAFLRVAKDAAPNAWVRQCGLPETRSGATDPKAVLLGWHSRHFRKLAQAFGMRTNSAFAGTYAFRPDADFPALFLAFLDGMPDGGLIMCHPGKVDAELERLDPLTTLRQREYDYFRSDAFPHLLAESGVSLA